jgi:tRNA G18 (ribose-2'-O)-methylase SpoU
MNIRKLQNAELNRLTVEEFKKAGKRPFIIVLDDIRSMHNVGSIFRTADAFLVEELHLCGITATPPHREINKTALGATESVSWKYVADIKDTIIELKQRRYMIAVAEQTDRSISLEELKPELDIGIAVVFGNEIKGVSEEVVRMADVCFEIPQFGTKHSLNVAVTAGIVTWHLSLLCADKKTR